MQLKQYVIYAAPVAALLVLPRVLGRGLSIRVTAVAGTKKRGIDRFGMAATVKNTGDLDISGWSLFLAAKPPTQSAIKVAWVDLSLAKGEEKRFPASGYYWSDTIPSNAELGSYSANAIVFDCPPEQTGTSVATKSISDAWQVVEPVRSVEITGVEVR